MTKDNRLFIKITRDTLPRIKDKYPFIYLEYGRLEIDDSSIKWIDSECNIVRLPVATINCILLGPGTSVTHEAIKVVSASNCFIAWVGEDGLLFYAAGYTPTTDSRNFRKQVELSTNKVTALNIARKLFSMRFSKEDVQDKKLSQLIGMEGIRVRALYEAKAKQYKVGWKGRRYTVGEMDLSDVTNQVLTSSNAALYGIICSVVHSLGYSPHIGFIHSGSPLPFVYDIADLYKEHLCIDLAFWLTLEMAGKYDKHIVSSAFRKRVIEMNLLEKITIDINQIFNVTEDVSSNSK